MSHIFISYSHKDSKYVEKLEKKLIEEGFNVWIDHRIDYGSQWPKVIQEQLDSCGAFIVVVSENAYESEWVQNEVARAKRKGKPFFPLLLSGDPWITVETTQYVDVKDGSLPPIKFYEELSNIVPQTLLSLENVSSAAVFIDGYWLYHTCSRQRILEKLDYTKLIRSFRDYFGDWTSVYYFYAINPDLGEQERHLNNLRKEGYIIELGSFMASWVNDGPKHIQVHGIDTLFVLRASTLPKEVKTVILITGDGDIAPLVEHLQSMPKNIILITEVPGSYALRKVIRAGVINLKSFLNDLNSNKNPFHEIKANGIL
ncbi:MAG: TIR domain-containing protein [Anaerolineales bacterium]|nr:TIR domain-containing protein [Anaerolineales bacterium]